MPLFRRRKDEDDIPDAAAESTSDEGPAAEGNVSGGFVDSIADAPEGDDVAPDPPYSRSEGPWDDGEAPETDVPRLDLGSLLVPGYAGLELRIEVDEQTGNVVSVAAVVDDAAVQIQVFAAPRNAGVWQEVRRELAEGIVSAGGKAEEADGPFGRELRTRIPVESPQGQGMQEARFVGVDGPRWFLRGVFSGRAYEPGGMPQLEGVFRGCVVVRGTTPMAPKDPLPLHLPDQPDGELEPPGMEPLEPFKRGPEITEIH